MSTSVRRRYHPVSGMLNWLEADPPRSARGLGLPTGARSDDLTASYADGVVEVRVPLDGDVAEPSRGTVQRTAA
jgi:hypothetical protein